MKFYGFPVITARLGETETWEGLLSRAAKKLPKAWRNHADFLGQFYTDAIGQWTAEKLPGGVILAVTIHGGGGRSMKAYFIFAPYGLIDVNHRPSSLIRGEVHRYRPDRARPFRIFSQSKEDPSPMGPWARACVSIWPENRKEELLAELTAKSRECIFRADPVDPRDVDFPKAL